MRLAMAKSLRRFLKILLVVAMLCAGAAYVSANVEFVDAPSGYPDAQESKSGC